MKIEMLFKVAEAKAGKHPFQVALNKIESIRTFSFLERNAVIKRHGIHVELTKIENIKSASGLQMIKCIFDYIFADILGKAVQHKADKHFIVGFAQLKRLVDTPVDEFGIGILPAVFVELFFHGFGNVQPGDKTFVTKILHHKTGISAGTTAQIQNNIILLDIHVADRSEEHTSERHSH